MDTAQNNEEKAVPFMNYGCLPGWLSVNKPSLNLFLKIIVFFFMCMSVLPAGVCLWA